MSNITEYISAADVVPLGTYANSLTSPMPTHDGGMRTIASIDTGAVPTSNLRSNIHGDLPTWGSCNDPDYDSISTWVKVDDVAGLDQDLYCAIYGGKIYLKFSSDALTCSMPDDFSECAAGEEGTGVLIASIDGDGIPTPQSQGVGDIGFIPCPMEQRETYLKTTDGRWRADLDWSILGTFWYWPSYYYNYFYKGDTRYAYANYRVVTIYLVIVDEVLCFYSDKMTTRMNSAGTETINVYGDYNESNYNCERCRYDSGVGFPAAAENLLPWNVDGSTPYTGTEGDFAIAPIAPTIRGRVASVLDSGCIDTSARTAIPCQTYHCFRCFGNMPEDDPDYSYIQVYYSYDPTIWEGRGLGTTGGADNGGHTLDDSVFDWVELCSCTIEDGTQANTTVTLFGGSYNHILLSSCAFSATDKADFYKWVPLDEDEDSPETLDPDDPEAPDDPEGDDGGWGGGGGGGTPVDPSGGGGGITMPSADVGYEGGTGVTVQLMYDDGDYYWQISIAADAISNALANLSTKGTLTYNADHTFPGANADIEMGISDDGEVNGTTATLGLVFHGTNNEDASTKTKTYDITYSVSPSFTQALSVQLPVDEELTVSNGVTLRAISEGSSWISCKKWYQIDIDASYLKTQLSSTLAVALGKKTLSDSQTSTDNDETLNGTMSGTLLNPTITIS